MACSLAAALATTARAEPDGSAPYFDLGLGGDSYRLWNVHGDAVEAAIALKAAANVWVTPELGVFANARAYP